MVRVIRINDYIAEIDYNDASPDNQALWDCSGALDGFEFDLITITEVVQTSAHVCGADEAAEKHGGNEAGCGVIFNPSEGSHRRRLTHHRGSARKRSSWRVVEGGLRAVA